MATVFIPAQLRDLTDGTPEIDLQATTLRQVMVALEEQFPGIKARLCDGDDLVPGLQVSIDHVMSSRGMLTKIGPTSEVHFLPAIGGG